MTKNCGGEKRFAEKKELRRKRRDAAEKEELQRQKKNIIQ